MRVLHHLSRLLLVCAGYASVGYTTPRLGEIDSRDVRVSRLGEIDYRNVRVSM